MSEKKLKQLRLPFQILSGGSPKSPKKDSPASSEKISPKVHVNSRKRKPSNDGDNVRSCKIGRVVAKENIAEDPVMISDDEKSNPIDSLATENDIQITPTTECVIHIKLPSSSKCKKKINMDLKSPNSSVVEEDDSIVYIDEQAIQNNLKKSKSSDKKNKKGHSAKKTNEASLKKKALNMNESIEESKNTPENDAQMEVDDDVAEKNNPLISDTILKLVDASEKTVSISDDNYQEEVLGVLSDGSEKSPSRKTSSADDSFSKPSSTPTHKLTPTALARRKEQEVKRIEKELQRQKERDEKEAQRLKEKEKREEAKRKEKEEKEEARRKEKEEKEVIIEYFIF
jgi:hypothetical protein